jgi:cell shape-determining protein MreC
VSIEERILNLPAFADYNDRRQLRAIALDVRKLEDRVKQLEQENDAMRADLLLWRDTTDAMCSKAGIGFTTEDKP